MKRQEDRTMKRTVVCIVILLLVASSGASGRGVHPVIKISVTDITTGAPIRTRQTITAGDIFQVTVTTNGVDCAGQFVVTALGLNTPAALVQFLAFTIGPASGNESVTGGQLTANDFNGGVNDWKISASCNGAARSQWSKDFFEFFAQP